ncbi:MAG: rhodanese-like domain-containing protein [Thermodesulfobacteriota bacterium]
MRKTVFLVLLFAGVLSAAAFLPRPRNEAGPAPATAAAPAYQAISPSRAQKLMKERPDLLLVDVRGPDELGEGMIAGSVSMPFMDLARGKTEIPKGRPVLLICAVGGRSLAVGKYLAASGYPEVYNLEGGIKAWKQAGLPVAR